ncbi:ABC transporter ATP-binding protein [Staphylococcus gallinarum]|uniref:ABC transporter ATP-binding protein n=2 Tax=Staphylococcus gallinarum TaxID=1293 RepID=UPI000E67A2CC|nr:ATP-binding cassette domain-containing protein [Staphylococcus gallinarum]MBU7216676.1 ATP-binding cassette domain-containing protein [Staphylococcus gallinarum]RIP05320.1 ATP-binding cassette domain-containing protein [Staphylococcus gallinarum]
MTDIKISNLNFQYADKVIFQNADFTISKETINRIDGDNGIGKTTLFHILSGNLQTEFTISPNQYFEFITTECLPFNELTGKELILLFFKLNNKKAEQFADYIQIFQELNIHPLFTTRYKNMSLGQQQKLTIIISFINKDKIVLLDEPFNALDKASKASLSNIFINLSKNFKRTIIYISHNDFEVPIDRRFYISNYKIIEIDKYYD